MTPDEFRVAAARFADWVATYHERVADLPVQPDVEPGWVRSQLPPAPPEQPERLDAVLADLDRVVLPAVTGWQSPGWFAYFPANTSFPAVLGDLVSSGLGQQGMLWSTSPACTELEAHVLDWVVDLLGLPERFRSTGPGGGVIQDSASSATLTALVAARHRAVGDGATLDRLVAYASVDAHSSVVKGARVAGLRDDQVRLIDVDADRAMRVDSLERVIGADLDAGRVPFFVVATAGTTSTCSFDPVAAIGAVTARAGMWLHVDAAFAGSAAVCPELRWVNDGLEVADSYAFNPHKWLFTTFDCDCFYVADRSALIDALSIEPEYLRNPASESGGVIDYRDWQIPLGRRFRALKLWFVIRHYGAEGLRHHVREHVALARDLAARIDADPRLELVVAPRLSLVCFRHVAGDDVTERLLAELNATGRVHLTHTRIDGSYVIRVSIGSTWTTGGRVDELWSHIARLVPS
jgi:aromatic-L-amino-acid decarboxylase